MIPCDSDVMRSCDLHNRGVSAFKAETSKGDISTFAERDARIAYESGLSDTVSANGDWTVVGCFNRNDELSQIVLSIAEDDCVTRGYVTERRQCFSRGLDSDI